MEIYLETERLILRDMRMEDLEGMYELDSNPKVHEYLGKKPVQTIDESKKIIDSVIEQYKNRGTGRFSVFEKSSGNFIGWSGIKYNTGDQETIGNKCDFYDIGYRLIPHYWGQGYGMESAVAGLKFGFSQLKLNTIEGAAETENLASNKILKNIGLKHIETFPFENVMLHWYALKREDYEKKMS